MYYCKSYRKKEFQEGKEERRLSSDLSDQGKASMYQQDGSVDKTVLATKYADLSLIPRTQMAEIKKTLLQAILRPTHEYVHIHIHKHPHSYQ